MPKKCSVANVETTERRKHWRDRRVSDERRNSERLRHDLDDCRSGSPRRASEVAGELSDGDVWWNKATTRFE